MADSPVSVLFGFQGGEVDIDGPVAEDFFGGDDDIGGEASTVQRIRTNMEGLVVVDVVILNMLRNHESVTLRHRSDVKERVELIILRHLIRRNLPLSYLCKYS